MSGGNNREKADKKTIRNKSFRISEDLRIDVFKKQLQSIEYFSFIPPFVLFSKWLIKGFRSWKLCRMNACAGAHSIQFVYVHFHFIRFFSVVLFCIKPIVNQAVLSRTIKLTRYHIIFHGKYLIWTINQCGKTCDICFDFFRIDRNEPVTHICTYV